MEETPSAPSPSDQPSEKTTVGLAKLVDVKMTVKANGKPLVGAIVELRSDPRRSVTDENGVVEFKQVEPGQHTLSVAYNGRTAETLVFIGAISTDPVQSLAIYFNNNPWYKQWSSWAGLVVALLLGLVPALIVRRRRLAWRR